MTDDTDNDRQLWRRSIRRPPDERTLGEAYRNFLAASDENDPTIEVDEILRADGQLAPILNDARQTTVDPLLVERIIALCPSKIQPARSTVRTSSVWIGWTSVAASLTLAAGMGLWAGRVASERARERQFAPSLTLWVGNADGLDSFLSVEEAHP